MLQQASDFTPPLIDQSPFAIRFPETDFGQAQDTEWAEVYLDGGWKKFRLHDYADIYSTPGLYEYLFYRTLKCCSPGVVVGLLADVVQEWPQNTTELNVLDLGAGNGMVGDELRALGIRNLVGVDIVPEAAEATQRDRPDLYDDYIVGDFCNLEPEQDRKLIDAGFNTLTTVAALGFGDIPPSIFIKAFNLISCPGWLAFNIKDTFLNGSDQSGFSRLIRELNEQGVIQMQAYRRYNHRLSVNGRRLFYVGMVARKLKPIPEELVRQLS